MKQWLLALVGAVSSAATLANNGFLVAPTHVDLNCNRVQTASFVATNTGDKTIHLRITPECYTTGSEALNIGKDLHPKTAQRVCINQNMLISPRAISLSPGQKRTVRVSVRPPQDLRDGDYRAHLLFSMLENAGNYQQQGQGADGHQLNMNMKIMFEMAVAVMCKRGTGSAKLTTHYQPKTKTLILTNKTPWRYRGDLKLYADHDRKPIKTVPLIVLRESQQEIDLKDLPRPQREWLAKWEPKEGYKDSGEQHCPVV